MKSFVFSNRTSYDGQRLARIEERCQHISRYMVVVFLAQVIAGISLLTGQFVPLSLAILAPVLVNILTFHITMDPGGIGPGLFATVLWAVAFLPYRSSFAQIFQLHPTEKTLTTR